MHFTIEDSRLSTVKIHWLREIFGLHGSNVREAGTISKYGIYNLENSESVDAKFSYLFPGFA
jgi:hypothetical protein